MVGWWGPHLVCCVGLRHEQKRSDDGESAGDGGGRQHVPREEKVPDLPGVGRSGGGRQSERGGPARGQEEGGRRAGGAGGAPGVGSRTSRGRRRAEGAGGQRAQEDRGRRRTEGGGRAGRGARG
eukprot:4829792-Prymnesium_polylepis.1